MTLLCPASANAYSHIDRFCDYNFLSQLYSQLKIAPAQSKCRRARFMCPVLQDFSDYRDNRSENRGQKSKTGENTGSKRNNSYTYVLC